MEETWDFITDNPYRHSLIFNYEIQKKGEYIMHYHKQIKIKSEKIK